MTVEQLANWGAFFIPLILLAMTGFIRKLVDGHGFRREHWYLGIDLTVYFLASTLVNLLDIAKAQHPSSLSLIWTVVLVAIAVGMLLAQAGLHQSWQSRAQGSIIQLVVLCGFSNFLGILLLYGFVKLKLGGLI